MSGSRDTRDLVTLRLEDIEDVCQSLRSISGELRVMGVGLQADKLETIAEHLQEGVLLESGSGHRAEGPLHPALLHLDATPPWNVTTPANMRYLGMRLTEAVELVEALMADAEITGSQKVLERAMAWLRKLGVRS